MKVYPLDMRHLVRNNLNFFRGIGDEGDPQYTLTSVLTGGGRWPSCSDSAGG